jgi:hypothetical protein
MTPEVAGFLATYGLPITMLLVALATGARGIWVWGRELQAANVRGDAAEGRAQEWQAIALKALRVGEKVVDGL